MEDIVSQTKAEYTRATERLIKLLDTTPDDKLNWSPSASARTPIQLAAHSADAVGGILGMLKGEPNRFTSAAELDTAIRASERDYKSKEQVMTLLEKNSADFIAFLDTMTPEQLSSTVGGFFGSSFPMAVAVTFPGSHMRGHVAQMEYVQTIWGDYNWYM